MDLLIASYIYADKIEEAYEFFLKAVESSRMPVLYIHGGEACVKLEKYDEAIQYFDKSRCNGNPFCE